MTLSDVEQGAQVVVYSESGEQVAAGPAVGRGNRWRHQIAVAPFGPNGELELAEVLTPHIGGIAGFYRMDGDSLNLVAQQDSVTSHSVVSRNFDMGLAGDLDGDGQPELVVLDQPFREVVASCRTPDGVAVAWRAAVGGKAVTNSASVESGAGISLGAGRDDGVLRIWLATWPLGTPFNRPLEICLVKTPPSAPTWGPCQHRRHHWAQVPRFLGRCGRKPAFRSPSRPRRGRCPEGRC